MKYYLKKCGFQELGSVGEDGKAKRGRYLMTSMNPEVLEFFPKLSKEIPNDNAVLPMIPLYTRLKTYCNYVYHNSKFTGTEAKHPRNEYRIYLNGELEGHKLYFAADDIMVLRKADYMVEYGDNAYFIDVIKDHSSMDYLRLSRYIEDYPIKGGYGVYDGDLDFFEEKVGRLKNDEVENDIVIDKSVTDRISKGSKESQANMFNPATFKDFVLAGYGNACAITGQIVKGIMGVGIDVVYIKPRESGGDCYPSNGLALVKELSLPFIQGKFTLSDRYEVLVHENNDDEYLNQFHLKQIRIPPNKFFIPDKENIRYHRENIFGKFLR